MTTVRDIETFLYAWAPRETAESWDNVGLLVGRGDREIRRVLAALDVTPAVAAEAAELGADLIVAHHPVMNVRWHEREMQTLRDDTRLGGLLTYLVRHDLSAICMHTNLDAAEGGVNDQLAKALGLTDTIPLNEQKIGKIIRLQGPAIPQRRTARAPGGRGRRSLRRIYPPGTGPGVRYLCHQRPAV